MCVFDNFIQLSNDKSMIWNKSKTPEKRTEIIKKELIKYQQAQAAYIEEVTSFLFISSSRNGVDVKR